MEKTYDIDKIRRDFPILNSRPYGRPLIYLDNGATTQKPQQVIQAMANYYENENANVHRGAHYLSNLATEAHEGARDRVRSFIGARDRASVIFTRNATEGINLVAYGWALHHLQPGDDIIISIAEHHSNLLPWQRVAQRTGANLQYVYLNPDGTFNLKEYHQLMKGRVRLVALQHTSNVLGTVNPLKDIIPLAHERGARVLIDGAQGVPHMKVDVEQMDCDFLVFSGHKMLGPMGSGILYVKEALLEEITPLYLGGEMIHEVEEQHATFAPPPLCFEAGTPNVGASLGLARAIDYLEEIGLEKIHQHEMKLTAMALEGLQGLDNIEIYGPLTLESRSGVISFNVKEVHPHDVATILDQEGIALRSGHHCAQPLMKYLDLAATCRISFYLYNTPDEVDAFISGIKKVRSWFPHGA